MLRWLRGRDQRNLVKKLGAENESLRAELEALRRSDRLQRNLIRALRDVNAALDSRLVERQTVAGRQFLGTC